jgi:uncharacterized membrane protein
MHQFGRMTGRIASAIAVVVLALLLVAPFFVARRGAATPGPRWLPVPETHDMRQHLSVLRQLDAAMRTGELYPRWQPELNKGYGLPWLNYYPPGFYWLAEIFAVATGDALDALFLVCVLLTIGCAVATYMLARQFFSRAASAGAAAFYVLAPYRQLDLYWRGALPELAGFVFVPVIVLLAYRAGSAGRLRWIAALGLVHGLYLMTHVPVAYLLTLTLGVYGVLWAAMQRDVRIALRIAAGLAWGFAIGAVYWLVAMLERKHVRETFSTDFPYHGSYVVLAPGDPFVLMLNASFAALAFALVATWVASRAEAADPQKRIFRILAAATVFMVTPYSIYLGRLIPNINSVSFAWRWIVIGALFVALVVAMVLERVREAPRAYGVLLVAALALNVGTSVRLMVRAFEKPNLDAPVSFVETGFVPGRAGDPEKLPDDAPLAAVVPNAGHVAVVKWEPLRREVLVTAAQPSDLHLRTYRFRGWTARIDGRPTAIGIDEYGAQVVRLAPGRHRVVVTFENPRTRTALAIVSAIAALAALAGVAFGRRKPNATLSS